MITKNKKSKFNKVWIDKQAASLNESSRQLMIACMSSKIAMSYDEDATKYLESKLDYNAKSFIELLRCFNEKFK